MNYSIDRNSGEAVYRQISRVISEEIKVAYEIGDAIATEPELAERFSVNRHTIRRAVDELIAAGLVHRHHGKGTFVISDVVDYPVKKGTRFTETLEKSGKETESRLLRKVIIPARGGVLNRLEVAAETPVIWLETLRFVKKVPFCVISHFLPSKKMTFVMDQYEDGSLHRLLNQYGIQVKRKQSIVTAVLPQGDDSIHLQMPRNRPVLRVKSINVDERTEKPVEYAVTRFRADRVQLNIAIS